MTLSPSLHPIIDQLCHARILCVGDIMLDRFVSGTVEQIAPDAPVPLLQITEKTETLGGVGNVAANLSALGAHTAIVSQIGSDSAGRRIGEILGQLDTLTDHLVTADHRSSTLQTRFMAAGQPLLRSISEDRTALNEETAAKIIATVTDEIEHYDALLLSDSGKGVLSDDICAALISLAKQADIPVIIDPHGKKYSKYAGATVITPDLQSLSAASDITAQDDASICAAAVNIITGCDIETVLAHRGRDGLSVISEDSEPVHLPAHNPQEIYDAAGSRDTLTAIIAAALGSGANIEQAAHIANIAGALTAGQHSPAVIDLQALKSAANPAG